MTLNTRIAPLFYLFAGLFGFAGVALAAAAAHGGGEAHLVASASTMCLAHAPALLALAIGAERLRTAWLAGILIGAGTLLFAGDLVALRYAGSGLFPMAAPTGGFAMMFGWLAIAAGALFRRS
ncbi:MULTISPECIES: DUF423 domain-containing protein [unclassified Rhizobium]|jgi:uncharacterized membrane protein YgdD (TMEM256/DUF423 family)|uniref:DUF423 domain-containing protein n=1 Tax=unclassified Rhizobium TaxID=2613769 RepID=UPI0016140139|nr:MULTISPECIES: DUF423 domain-containing protein [unclassified Rhizobium]MBB3317047.1 uncharacterized membrane protein YgdD (TMEM256/DUF423 family) [Rhizobium sp. BK181]MBB3541107.1 uncharacterized membrane protein YgdD (TMEM256/DUF423 family) [Rhizobium sp. BK399]MCS3739832.1 uncharacterized membrane protein YgdD (TMEM256/DUF423 family) [Rhizobium sp. BK661]MCS4092219.1 uncharacterized membrane protein YgdD (TMEM256/DUF423 family) [Rhizobium sp. BK176]